MRIRAKANSRSDGQLFILAMDEPEAAFFAGLLERDASIARVSDLASLRAAVSSAPSRTRLISFCSALIVPPDVLTFLGHQCFNFHPGPPERPGYRPAAFAASEKATAFGVTFHSMVSRVDAGPIHRVRRFLLAESMDETAITTHAYEHLVTLARKMAVQLADFRYRFPALDQQWTGTRTTKRDYETLTLDVARSGNGHQA